MIHNRAQLTLVFEASPFIQENKKKLNAMKSEDLLSSFLDRSSAHLLFSLGLAKSKSLSLLSPIKQKDYRFLNRAKSVYISAVIIIVSHNQTSCKRKKKGHEIGWYSRTLSQNEIGQGVLSAAIFMKVLNVRV